VVILVAELIGLVNAVVGVAVLVAVTLNIRHRTRVEREFSARMKAHAEGHDRWESAWRDHLDEHEQLPDVDELQRALDRHAASNLLHPERREPAR
jgi:hypothetical protein